MNFDNGKKVALSKIDKSKKGRIDKEIKPLINLINKSRNYYTTSSCSGRIVLIKQAEGYKKNEAEWLFVSHSPVKFSQIKNALKKIENYPKEDIWLREESIIMHIACRTLKDAEILLNKIKPLGFKRSGIASAKKIILEIMATENMDAIIAKKGKLLVNDAYLRILTEEANKKLKRTQNKIKRVCAALRKTQAI